MVLKYMFDAFILVFIDFFSCSDCKMERIRQFE